MPTNVIMPQMGESIVEGTVTRWLKKAGDSVVRDEPLFEISTDKVDSEIPSPASGILSEIMVKEGETVQINTVVAVIQEADRSIPERVNSSHAKAVEAPAVESSAEGVSHTPVDRGPSAIRSSPLVRRIAREEHVNLHELEGTGLRGRVTKKDILSFLEGRHKSVEPAPPSTQPATSDTVAGTMERIEVVPMTPMRRSIAEHMLTSRRTSAHVTTVFEVDMTRIVNIKTQEEQEFQHREGVKLSFMPFFIKATAAELKKWPIVNASIVGTQVVYKKDINVAVAVALDWGLIAPVIKNADEKSFIGLARASANLADRARRKKLSPEEVQNGTFTITNPGVFGSLLGTPIINQPQVAILCVGAITKRPVIINDAIAIRSMAYLTLTFDHRLIDGAIADQFMAGIKARLEDWNENLQ